MANYCKVCGVDKDLSHVPQGTFSAKDKILIGTCGDCDAWEIILEGGQPPIGKCWSRNMTFWDKDDGCKKWKEKEK